MKKLVRDISRQAKQLGLTVRSLDRPGHLLFEVFHDGRYIGQLSTSNTPKDSGVMFAITRDLKRLKHQGESDAIPKSGGREWPQRRDLA